MNLIGENISYKPDNEYHLNNISFRADLKKRLEKFVSLSQENNLELIVINL